MWYGRDHRFPDLGNQVVELGSVVPRRGSAVVAVVDVTGPAISVVVMLEYHCCVAPLPVTVIDMEADIRRKREVRAVETVGGVWADSRAG